MSENYVLKLYITGRTPKIEGHIKDLEHICKNELGQYELQVINILEQPQLADGDRILATPTLIKSLPEPVRRVIGDISDTEKALIGLDLITRGK